MIEKINNLINDCLLNNKIDSTVDDWMFQKAFKSYKKYTSNGYFEKINTALRTRTAPDALTLDYIADLDKLFSTYPSQLKNKTPMKVYRGISFNSTIDNFFNNNPKGKIYTDKGFVSTSKDKFSAKNFAQKNGILFEITIPENSRVIDDSKLPSFARSFIDSEEEVLLPRNSQFKIIEYNNQTKTAKLEYIGPALPLEMPKVSNARMGADIISETNKILLKKPKNINNGHFSNDFEKLNEPKFKNISSKFDLN